MFGVCVPLGYGKVAGKIECSFLLNTKIIMPVYDDISQEDSSTVEMKKRTKEMKLRVAKVLIVITSLNFTVLFRFLNEM